MSSTQDTLNLPNYFLADLPREATLTPAMILEACQTLRRNRDAYLAGRSTRELIDLLCEVGAKWRSPDYHFRKLALREGPAATGFPETTLARGLDEFFAWFRPEHFHDLLKQDLGHTRALEPLNPDDIESRLALVRAPKLLVHVTAGMIPNPVFLNICLGVLLRAAQVVKCPTGASLLPRLFAHSLYDADRKLGACLEIAEWRGGNAAIEDPLFAQAHCVTATGSDETLLAIRNRLPPGALGNAQLVPVAQPVSGHSVVAVDASGQLVLRLGISDDASTRAARLALTEATKTVLAHGMALLGLQAVEAV